jgi:methylenetetrahydrofolate--tRNA-(uracil-5-)-methyltransferase
MLGALYRYLRECDAERFQPMNANFGLLDPLPPDSPRRDREAKKRMLADRALADIDGFAARLSAAVPA